MQYDIAYIAGWDWINYWPNFLEGMNYSKHAWKQTACVSHDRTNGTDGWNSAVLDWTQRAFHPYLVFDVQSYAANPRYAKGWPVANVSSASTGATVSRELVIFNDVVDAPLGRFTLRWSGHWEGGSSGRKAVVTGSTPGKQPNS